MSAVCSNCSAPLEGADLERPNCRFCGALHPHIARAAEKVEVVKQLLAPGPNGMPVALAAMMGHAGAAPPGGHAVAPGMAMSSSSSVVMVNGVVVQAGQAGQAPPMLGGPVGGRPGGVAGGPVGAYGAPQVGGVHGAPGFGAPGFGNPYAMHAAAISATQRTQRAGKIALIVGMIVGFVVLTFAMALVWLMAS